jgi:hypothetical protein
LVALTAKGTEGKEREINGVFDGGYRKISRLFKVPRQCPLFLLIRVRLREGKALGK